MLEAPDDSMSTDAIRDEWTSLRDRVVKDALERKAAEESLAELSEAYTSYSREERAVVDEVLAEWVDSDDLGRRFDALALISEHRIASALPAVRRLARKLALAKEPWAQDERDRVVQVVRELTTSASGT